MPDPAAPSYLHATAAFREFARSVETQSQRHIRPLHWHFALRLVIEGGFLPDEITPRPPIRVERGRAEEHLVFDPEYAREGEQTVLGGLKTKDIDIVVAKEGIGPVPAISVKGTTGAFRNLTNRMEEAIGDSTNLHIMYPGLVYGFFQIIRANRSNRPGILANDIALTEGDTVVTSIRRYHDVLTNLCGRRFVRDDFTRYEGVGFALIEASDSQAGQVLDLFPPTESPLRYERFIANLLEIYDLRYPYVAASLPALKRRVWSRESPALLSLGTEEEWPRRLGYVPRVA